MYVFFLWCCFVLLLVLGSFGPPQKPVLFAGFGLSLVIELSQLLNNRRTDIDDLILNFGRCAGICPVACDASACRARRAARWLGRSAWLPGRHVRWPAAAVSRTLDGVPALWVLSATTKTAPEKERFCHILWVRGGKSGRAGSGSLGAADRTSSTGGSRRGCDSPAGRDRAR